MKTLLRVMALSWVRARMERLKSWSLGSSTHLSESSALGMKSGGFNLLRWSVPSASRLRRLSPR